MAKILEENRDETREKSSHTMSENIHSREGKGSTWQEKGRKLMVMSIRLGVQHALVCINNMFSRRLPIHHCSGRNNNSIKLYDGGGVD